VNCPCGSGAAYASCCGKYHEGAFPENALALMRSRYSAYAKGLADYIITTTHPDYRQEEKPWRASIVSFCQNTHFVRLEVLSFEEGEPVSFVTFNAHLEQNHQPVLLHEKSRFEKVNGKWFYLDGIVKIR
jgi:SEC-C motif-containing protein